MQSGPLSQEFDSFRQNIADNPIGFPSSREADLAVLPVRDSYSKGLMMDDGRPARWMSLLLSPNGAKRRRWLHASFRRILPAVLIVALSLALLLIGARGASLRLAFDVNKPDAVRSLVGFHAVECTQAGCYRWSQPQSWIFLYGFDGRTITLDLSLIAPDIADSPPTAVAFSTHGRSLVQISVPSQRRHYHLLVPTTITGDNGLLLRSSTVQPGGEDTRDIGVALSEVVAQPIDLSGGILPVQRTIFLVTLPLLAWLLLERLGANNWVKIGVVGTLSLSIGWGGGYPLMAGYVLPTVSWPWWPLAPLLGLLGPSQLTTLLASSTGLVRRYVPFAPWSGLALASAALLALRLGTNMPLSIVGLLTGAFVAVASLRTNGDEAADHRRPPFEVIAVSTITIIALGLRLYHVDTQPLGLWRDEARHGLIALRIWQDPAYRPIYVVEGADLPALLFYLMAPFVGILGPHVWTVRLVSALAGGLAPLALWWTIRPCLGAGAALIAAALLACASWSLSMSRWAFPATLDQLLVLLAIGLMWRSLSAAPDAGQDVARRWQAAILGGMAALCAGLAVYTYHTGRIAPVLLAVLSAIQIGWSRARWHRAMPALIVAAVVGMLVLVPLLRFIAADFSGFNRRTSQVMVINISDADVHAPLLLVLRNVWSYLLMWHVHGDANGRHHAPGAPMVDPVVGLLLLLGIGLGLSHRHRGTLALGVWLGLGLVPGLFSGGAPHAMRSFGALAPACGLAGLALMRLYTHVRRSASRRGAYTMLGAMLVGSIAFNSWLYFVRMAHDPAVVREFDVASTAMARVARAATDAHDPELRSVRVFLPPVADKDDVRAFLLYGMDVGVFDGQRLSALPGEQTLLLLPTNAPRSWHIAATRLLGTGVAPLTSLPVYPGSSEPLFLAYSTGDAPARLLHETLP